MAMGFSRVAPPHPRRVKSLTHHRTLHQREKGCFMSFKDWSADQIAHSIRVFDFFSGCGGTSIGMKAAGMEIVFGLDNDPDAGKTFEAKFPEAAFLERDIQQFPTEDLTPYVEADSDRVLLFSACAPCQPFFPAATRCPTSPR